MEFTPVFEKINYDTAKGKIKEQIRAVSKTEVAVGAVSWILIIPFTSSFEFITKNLAEPSLVIPLRIGEVLLFAILIPHFLHFATMYILSSISVAMLKSKSE